MATLNFADVYGSPSSAGGSVTPSVQVTGPNPSSVTGGTQGNPVSNTGNSGTSPAFTWLGFVATLGLLRLIIEVGGRRGS